MQAKEVETEKLESGEDNFESIIDALTKVVLLISDDIAGMIEGAGVIQDEVDDTLNDALNQLKVKSLLYSVAIGVATSSVVVLFYRLLG